jgi:hypothetical protein
MVGERLKDRLLAASDEGPIVQYPLGHPPRLRSDGSAGDKLISPLPVALVEGRRRVQWCPPGTPDSVAARKAKAFHQVN